MYKFAFTLLLAAVSANESEMELEGAVKGRGYGTYGAVNRGTVNTHNAPGYYYAPKPKRTSYNYAPKPKNYSYSWNPKPKTDYWEHNPKPRSSSYKYNPKPLQSDWKDGSGYSHKSGIICQNGVCKKVGGKGTYKDNHHGNYSNPDPHGLGLAKGGDGYGDYGFERRGYKGYNGRGGYGGTGYGGGYGHGYSGRGN